jgi:ribosomal protein L11 methyltransferase
VTSVNITANARAFGDGQHATTKLMLAAIAAIDPKEFTPRVACDMGCGSGILSLAIAQKFHCPVVAVDVLRESVEATRANAAANGFACHPGSPHLGRHRDLPPLAACHSSGDPGTRAGMTVIHSDGFRHPDIAPHAPFDLIVMNILAEPLLALAADAYDALAPAGVLIVSGVFVWQEMQTLRAYEGLGLERTERLQLDDWLALVFQRPA